jgi:predicted TIM-barrel fold metal-dependent hydrolase
MPSLRRIDSHHHIVPPFYAQAAMAAGAGPTRGRFPDWSPQRGLDLMDANDIQASITSVSFPGVHFFTPAKARRIARQCNEFAAGLCARWPKRYGAFATVPMHNPRHAIEEIDYALDELKLDGICLLTSYAGVYLGDPKFDPVFDALNDRKAVVYTHPAHEMKLGLPWPGFMIEYTFDTTRAAANLMFTGAIKRYPRVRIILSHAGGTLPYLAWRLHVASAISTKIPKWSYQEVRKGLRHFWYDTALSAGPELMDCLVSVVGPDRVVFGTDWPFGTASVVKEAVKNLSSPGFLSATRRADIARRNALALFPRFAG